MMMIEKIITVNVLNFDVSISVGILNSKKSLSLTHVSSASEANFSSKFLYFRSLHVLSDCGSYLTGTIRFWHKKSSLETP